MLFRSNETRSERVFLHLVFAPYWAIVPIASERNWNGVSEEKQKRLKLDDIDLRGSNEEGVIDGMQNGHKETNGLRQEYNDGFPLHSPKSPLLSWVVRAKQKCVENNECA